MAEVSIDVEAMGSLVSALETAKGELTGAAAALKSNLALVWLSCDALRPLEYGGTVEAWVDDGLRAPGGGLDRVGCGWSGVRLDFDLPERADRHPRPPGHQNSPPCAPATAREGRPGRATRRALLLMPGTCTRPAETSRT